ncbi:MAG: DNA polymerase III subunit epsilon, partial [Pseudomonadales bacterium]|nr:DNA polymerase III subunit epsilon [Pseudomonadales bacterium]
MRELALDTETTGLEARDHRIIEVACVEIVNGQITGREFHVYVNPERSLAREARRVHGFRTSD